MPFKQHFAIIFRRLAKKIMVLLYLIVFAPDIGSKILPLLMTMTSHWPPLVGSRVSGDSNDHGALT